MLAQVPKPDRTESAVDMTSDAASKAMSEKFSPRMRPNCARMFACGSSDEKAMAAVCSGVDPQQRELSGSYVHVEQ